MEETELDFVRFEKLQLQNYGVFAGVQNFTFNPDRTVIVALSGAGKTTLCRALAYLRAARHILPNEHASTAEMKVTVTTSGNRDLIRKYRRLIFLRDRDMAACGKQAPNLMAHLDAHRREACQKAAAGIFAEIMEGASYQLPGLRNLDPFRMGSSASACQNLAYFIAVRNALGLDLPMVFECPYTMIPLCSREQVDAVLLRQRCQQIFILKPQECGDEPVHYRLGLPRDRAGVWHVTTGELQNDIQKPLQDKG